MFSAIFSFGIWGWPAPVPLRFHSWGMSSPIALQGCLLRDSVRQTPKWPKSALWKSKVAVLLSPHLTSPRIKNMPFCDCHSQDSLQPSHHLPALLSLQTQTMHPAGHPTGLIMGHIMEKLYEFQKLLVELTTCLRKLFVEIYFVCFNKLLVL